MDANEPTIIILFFKKVVSVAIFKLLYYTGKSLFYNQLGTSL